MSLSEWTILESHIQGDISFYIRKSTVVSEYVDFDLIAFSEKYQSFDVAFEYRIDDRNEWETNAIIISTTASYLTNNKLYGLSASKYGEQHLIRWKYIDNGILNGSAPQIRIRVLPRLRIFSKVTDNYSISSVYGERLVDYEAISTNNCIGIDNKGRYMCVNSTSFYILESLDGAVLYTYAGLSNPSFAIQINSGRYIICDIGNNRIIELESDLSLITKTYAGAGLVYVDYSEENETLLITDETLGRITEITWSDIDDGTAIWQSASLFNVPQAARYKQNTVDDLIIADTGNNRIVKYDKTDDSYSIIDHYQLSPTYSGPYEMSLLSSPYRVCWYSNGDICVVEKQGKQLDFETIESSSSSSSSSSIDSSSSSSIDSSSSSSIDSSSSSSSSSSIDSSSSSSSSSFDNRSNFEITTILGSTTVGIEYDSASSLRIDWGDGSYDIVNGSSEKIHDYIIAETFTLTLQGACTRFRFLTNPSRLTAILSPIQGITGLTSFNSSFYNTAIESIPSGLFNSCPSVTNFGACFGECDFITSIPSGLFDTQRIIATDFSQCFAYCDNLTSIPSELFNAFSSVINFSSCFQSCISLTSVPSLLFWQCSGFDLTFRKCFANCVSLTTISSNTFESCFLVINFYATFANCTSLTLIPDALFNDCPFVDTFESCFQSCGPTLGGDAPYLWDRIPEPTGVSCFNGDPSLGNIGDIPLNWK